MAGTIDGKVGRKNGRKSWPEKGPEKSGRKNGQKKLPEKLPEKWPEKVAGKNGQPDTKLVEKEYLVHRPIQWSAWTSTTTEIGPAKDFAGPDGVVMTIQVKTGKVIDAISMWEEHFCNCDYY